MCVHRDRHTQLNNTCVCPSCCPFPLCFCISSVNEHHHSSHLNRKEDVGQCYYCSGFRTFTCFLMDTPHWRAPRNSVARWWLEILSVEGRSRLRGKRDSFQHLTFADSVQLPNHDSHQIVCNCHSLRFPTGLALSSLQWSFNIYKSGGHGTSRLRGQSTAHLQFSF